MEHEKKNIKAEENFSHSEMLIRLCIALSREKDMGKLFEMIVDNSRAITNSQAGTLYIVESGFLIFEILQNEPMGTRYKKDSSTTSPLENVPLYINDRPNYSNVSSCAAITGEIINISDVYHSSTFDFSGTRKYDKLTGFRSRSMLVLPLMNHEDKIIAVLQLINRVDERTGEITSFSEKDIDNILPLASQAAVTATKVSLIETLRDMFYSFIKAIATAIDTKSPYTGEHVKRVVSLSMKIAECVNNTKKPPYKDFRFSDDEMEELKLAAWMHDIGKVTTPQHIIDKSTKLETLSNGIDEIRTRFSLIRAMKKNEYYRKLIEINFAKDDPEYNILATSHRQQLEADLESIHSDFELIQFCNTAGVVVDAEKRDRLKSIFEKTITIDGEHHSYITEKEFERLCISKGTLTKNERKIIENHAAMTDQILRQLHFPEKLSKIPLFAASHHEKLNGTGYPCRLKEEEIPIQARIMALADIFEALTAKNRPYKEEMSTEQAVKILTLMARDNEIDKELLELCVSSGLFSVRP